MILQATKHKDNKGKNSHLSFATPANNLFIVRETNQLVLSIKSYCRDDISIYRNVRKTECIQAVRLGLTTVLSFICEARMLLGSY